MTNAKRYLSYKRCRARLRKRVAVVVAVAIRLRTRLKLLFTRYYKLRYSKTSSLSNSTSCFIATASTTR